MEDKHIRKRTNTVNMGGARNAARNPAHGPDNTPSTAHSQSHAYRLVKDPVHSPLVAWPNFPSQPAYLPFTITRSQPGQYPAHSPLTCRQQSRAHNQQ